MTPTLTIELGCTVWEKAPGGPDQFYEPRGGCVWNITDAVDTDTGEKTRLFSVVKTYRGRLSWSVLREDQIDPFTAEAPSWFNARPVARAIWKRLYDHKGPINDDYVHHVEVAARLIRIFR